MTAAKASNGKPPLILDPGDLPATARALRDLFAADGTLYDRYMPAKLVRLAGGGPTIARPLTVNNVVIEAHHICQPVKPGKDGAVSTTLPERVARMYLDMIGEWSLPPLAGISTAPLLARDGAIRHAVGYDKATGLWCCQVPLLSVADRPRHDDAAAALRVLREAFKTFPFAELGATPRSGAKGRGYGLRYSARP